MRSATHRGPGRGCIWSSRDRGSHAVVFLPSALLSESEESAGRRTGESRRESEAEAEGRDGAWCRRDPRKRSPAQSRRADAPRANYGVPSHGSQALSEGRGTCGVAWLPRFVMLRHRDWRGFVDGWTNGWMDRRSGSRAFDLQLLFHQSTHPSTHPWCPLQEQETRGLSLVAAGSRGAAECSPRIGFPARHCALGPGDGEAIPHP